MEQEAGKGLYQVCQVCTSIKNTLVNEITIKRNKE